MRALMAIFLAYAATTLVSAASSKALIDDRREDRRSRNVVTESILREFHVFHGKDGKVVRGRIKAFNQENETVTVIKENGKPFTVELDLFSEADHAHVREWHLIKNFFTQLHIQTFTRNNRSGAGTEILIYRPWEEIIYDIVLENRGSYDLDDLTVDYCIYYELDRPGNRGREVKQSVECGSLTIGTLAGGAKVQLKTRPLVLSKGISLEYYKDNQEPAGKVKGIGIRIYLPLDSGNQAMRQLSMPSSLIKNRKWIETDAPLLPIN